MALTGTIGNDPAKFDPDYIYEAAALPNATDATSSTFKMGRTQGGVQLTVQADTTVNIADGQSLKIELLHDTSATGDFADSVVIYDETASGSAIAFAVDATIIKYIAPDDVESYNKLKITTSADESGDDINAFLSCVAH
jgi:hypothetical protein